MQSTITKSREAPLKITTRKLPLCMDYVSLSVFVCMCAGVLVCMVCILVTVMPVVTLVTVVKVVSFPRH